MTGSGMRLLTSLAVGQSGGGTVAMVKSGVG